MDRDQRPPGRKIRLHHELDGRQDHADGLEGQEVADDGQLREERGEDGHVEGPTEVLQPLEGRVQQLVAARARRELGLRRRDGREDELPPRRARVQLAAGDQGRRADARARWRGREEQCCLEEGSGAATWLRAAEWVPGSCWRRWLFALLVSEAALVVSARLVYALPLGAKHSCCCKTVQLYRAVDNLLLWQPLQAKTGNFLPESNND